MSASPMFDPAPPGREPDIIDHLKNSQRLMTARELASILAISPENDLYRKGWLRRWRRNGNRGLDADWRAVPLHTTVLEVADQFSFFGIDTDDGKPLMLKAGTQ
jgi:hypothetical protein